MAIRVTIERVEPLTGTVVGESGDAVPFAGWLGLISVLADLVATAGQSDGSPTLEA